MTQIEYSKRLGLISNEQLQRALDKFNLGKLTDTSKIEEGLFGQNLFLTSDQGEFVLRGVPHFDWQFPTEKFFSELLHSKTQAPIPYPYLVDEDKSIFGWPYIIMPKMPGVNIKLEQLETDEFIDEKESIARALAEVLTELHKLKWDTTGKYDLADKIIKPFENSYVDFVKESVVSRLTKAVSYKKNTTQEDIDWALDLIDESLAELEVKKGTYVMQDFKLENLTLSQLNGEWKVTGVFDLMESYFGFPESDLARTYVRFLEHPKLKELANIFVDKYLTLNSISKTDFQKRFPAFILFDRSIIWEWNQRKVDAKQTTSFRKYISKYLL